MGLKIHKREQIVDDAAMALATAWAAARRKLTTAEELAVIARFVTDTVGGIAKYAIREERHGDTDKPGGLE